ncbi:hypothetical protein E4O03_03635 [Treponema sp. OMZ 792]|uniref:hypothetical protein n=1 Tax=unclassified Treponema TaxID=2638727 RepID=UPI0020A406CD|nr:MULTISPECIES: hypothetical protein [unclassified Treponema]UTC73979.1 hypothetical protein E4O03_03635 [Treponema sp. OMZ 792]UTC79154.1 hypothetical protein E4O07_03650 [Treponema sp. OMZ 798]
MKFLSTFHISRTAIEREQKQFIKIAFAVHLSARLEAQAMLLSLVEDLSPSELDLMSSAIIEASKFIEKVAANGGLLVNGAITFDADIKGNRGDIIWNGKNNIVLP